LVRIRVKKEEVGWTFMEIKTGLKMYIIEMTQTITFQTRRNAIWSGKKSGKCFNWFIYWFRCSALTNSLVVKLLNWVSFFSLYLNIVIYFTYYRNARKRPNQQNPSAYRYPAASANVNSNQNSADHVATNAVFQTKQKRKNST